MILLSHRFVLIYNETFKDQHLIYATWSSNSVCMSENLRCLGWDGVRLFKFEVLLLMEPRITEVSLYFYICGCLRGETEECVFGVNLGNMDWKFNMHRIKPPYSSTQILSYRSCIWQYLTYQSDTSAYMNQTLYEK